MKMDKEPSKEKAELDIKSIEIRSEAVQEILGYIPHWIIRWGISLLFSVILVLLIGSYFFKYPDVISSSIVVTTVNPPASIVANSSGKIQHLFIKDKQEVEEGKYLAIIENSVNQEHLSELKIHLDSIKSMFNHFDNFSFIEFNPNYSLGELQASYANFLKSYADYRYFIQLDYHHKRIDSLNEQIEKHHLLREQLTRQLKILEEELKLSKQQYERSQSLYKDGVISRNDSDSAKGLYLQREYAFEGAKSSLANEQIQISVLQQSILDLELKYKEQKKQLEGLLKQAYENLIGQVTQWEQRYVLKTPINGVVTFTRFWSVNQNVRAGDSVITVVPREATTIIGKVVLPVAGSGKVKIGQKVNVKLANYPFMEYGMVRGIVKSKSLVSADNNYHLEVEFPHRLLTNYGKELEFNQEMQGVAEIITEDIRMLERVFKPIKSILEKHEED